MRMERMREEETDRKEMSWTEPALQEESQGRNDRQIIKVHKQHPREIAGDRQPYGE